MKTSVSPKISAEDFYRTFETPGGSRKVPLMGVEYERLGCDRRSGEAIPFEGAHSVQAVLGELARDYGWVPRTTGAHITSLKKDEALITLEPGGQMELSTPPQESIRSARDFETRHLSELRAIGDRHDILWCGFGVHPVSSIAAIPWVPKERYQIMREYFRGRGVLAHAMMKQTSSIQVTMDYRQEDISEKFRASMRMAPILTAMFANSCFSEGRPSGYKSLRSHIWQHTDSHRCGLVRAAFEREFTLADYVNYALDVPLFFIQRKGRLWGNVGKSFREFQQEGWEGESATLEDWTLHLTCLFPETRIRQWLEVRSVDRQSGILAFAVPVFLKAILYSPRSRGAVLRLLGRYDYDQGRSAMASAARDALEGTYGGVKLLDLARECLQIAREGMVELTGKGYFSPEDQQAMDAMDGMIRQDGVSPADRLLREYDRGKTLLELVRESAL